MQSIKKSLYHVHRIGNMDDFWQNESTITIGNNFESILYTGLLEDENVLIQRYGNYDIDYIIKTMEDMKSNHFVEDDMQDQFDQILNRYYFLRREKALEEGRKIFCPNAPSRLHSIFLTDQLNLYYWKKLVGDHSFKVFLLELEGNLFVSSDKYFPSPKLTFNLQVEKSKEYWKPKIKKLTPHKEFIFQGEGKIIQSIKEI